MYAYAPQENIAQKSTTARYAILIMMNFVPIRMQKKNVSAKLMDAEVGRVKSGSILSRQ